MNELTCPHCDNIIETIDDCYDMIFFMNKKEKIKCPYCSESLNSDEIGEEKNDITT